MANSLPGWFDALQLDPALGLEQIEDLSIASLRVIQRNGRFLYLLGIGDLAEFAGGQRRILESLSRHGDTVFVSVGQPGQIQLSYRLPDLENAVALGSDGLVGIIGQWAAWAGSAAA